MIEFLRLILRKTGFTKIYRLFQSALFNERLMKFPTFPNEIHKSISLNNDYYRFATMLLAMKRINIENIKGNMAEVGVFRGETSKILYKMLGERTFYLFDTFEGFPDQDREKNNFPDKRFKNTSVEIVMQNIGSSKNVIVRKGYIPDSLNGLENEKFAFVLLDLDLYAPTWKSLEFFYERLTTGGYIFVHDYNNPESNWACRRAVNEFMKDKCEKIIEIADNWGTVMFRKI